MPNEIRHLIFSAGETVEAITAYNRSRGVAMPNGTVAWAGPVETQPGKPVSFSVSVLSDTAVRASEKDKTEEVALGGPDLIAALIGYCRKCSIPVPLKGSKVLERFGSQVGLVITIAGRGSTLLEKLKI